MKRQMIKGLSLVLAVMMFSLTPMSIGHYESVKTAEAKKQSNPFKTPALSLLSILKSTDFVGPNDISAERYKRLLGDKYNTPAREAFVKRFKKHDDEGKRDLIGDILKSNLLKKLNSSSPEESKVILTTLVGIFNGLPEEKRGNNFLFTNPAFANSLSYDEDTKTLTFKEKGKEKPEEEKSEKPSETILDMLHLISLSGNELASNKAHGTILDSFVTTLEQGGDLTKVLDAAIDIFNKELSPKERETALDKVLERHLPANIKVNENDGTLSRDKRSATLILDGKAVKTQKGLRAAIEGHLNQDIC